MTETKIVDIDTAKKIITGWKSAGSKIVFTNGCFDLVHLGHIDYLEKARGKGDKLVLGLNTDQSVKKLKGEKRPLVNEFARSRMMAAFQFIDLVILFDEPTPQELIESIKPDILVKGNDYSIENIVGAEFVLKNGGKVETIDLVEGFSTTKLIEKIIQLH
ncbi:MAG: D-glycero-beta-D-manno-heptose 1-phosphate adenylyltransferase [Bacteroidota bacterium]